MLKNIWSACANRATALVALGMLTLSGMSSAQAAPTITPTGPRYSCDALYAVNAQGVVGVYPGATDVGVWKIMEYTGGTPTLLNPAELTYRATSYDDWEATGVGGQTLAIGYRGGEGNGPLAMYSWGIDSNDYQYMYYVLGDGSATAATRLPSTGVFPPADITAFPSGEVYQRTGEVFLAGPQSGSNSALRIRRYNPVTGAIIDSGQILPAHSSDAGMVGFQGDMAIDAEGSIYMLALDRVGGNPWLVRIRPGGNGSGWTYNKVFQISGINFSTSAVDFQAIYGMAFLGGKLFVAQGVDIYQIDLFTHLATRVGTPPIMDNDGARLYDLASCQTAPVIKGKVYNDADADGVISGSEDGVAGVTVELYKAGSNTPVSVQQTSGGGEYTFIVDDYNATYYVRLKQPQIDSVNAAQTWASAQPAIGGSVNGTTAFCTSGTADNQMHDRSGACLGAHAIGADPDTVGSIQNAQIYSMVQMTTYLAVAEADFGLTIGRNFGDAPDSYGTTVANNGPGHIAGDAATGVASLLRLGATAAITHPSSINPNVEANSDTSDDGVDVTLNGSDVALQNVVLISGKTYTFKIKTNGTASDKGYLNAWVGWNSSGLQSTFVEQIVANQLGVSNGIVNVSYTVPANSAVGLTPAYVRFRFSTRPDLGPTGNPAPTGAQAWAINGEVEDYKINMAAGQVRLAAQTTGGTGTFDYSMSNISTASPSTNTQTLTTTAENTLVYQGPTEYHVFSTVGTDIVISPASPLGDWSIVSAVCTDESAGVSGNPSGNLPVTVSGNIVTIPGGNVRNNADILCQFTYAKAADLTIVKTIDVQPLLVGRPFNYVFTITNNSTTPATQVVLSDLVQIGITITAAPSGASCTVTGGSAASFPFVGNGSTVLTCTLPTTVPAGSSVTITMPAVPNRDAAGNKPKNTATWTPDGGGTPEIPVVDCPATLSYCTQVEPTDNVGLLLVDKTIPTDQQPLVVGREFLYNFTITNNTAQALTSITIRDRVPANITILQSMQGGSCTPALPVTGDASDSTLITCTVPVSVAANGGTATIQLKAKPEPAAAGTTPINTVTWAPDGTGTPEDPVRGCPANLQPYCDEDGGPTDPVDAGVDLQTNKTLVGGQLKVGVESTYQVTVSNQGQGPTTAVTTTTDEVPANLTVNSAAPAAGSPAGSVCNVSGQTVTCTTPAGLAAGSSVTYEIKVTPTAASSGTSITNRAVSEGGGDSQCPPGSAEAKCSGTTTDPVGGGAQLTTTKSVTPMTVGQVSVYTITVTNNGTSPTTDITTTVDNVDATLVINSAQATSGGGSCSVAGQRVVCTVPIGLAVGASAIYEISVTPTRASSTGIINVAQTEGGGDTDCPVGNTNTACQGISGPDQVKHADVGNLRVVKQASVREANVGDLVRYTLTITNVGTLDVTDYLIVDTPPQGFSYVAGSATVSTGDTLTVTGNGPIQFGGLNLRVGEEAQIVYLLRVGAGVRPGKQVNTAEAYVWAGDSEPTSISNRATAEVTVMANDPMLDESLLMGTVYHDRNGNGMQDEGEEGLPGVRIATVEGLLIETDQYGRYHLEGILGGEWSRGRNFIMKVDPATLPGGAQFTTDNPLIRRITPGLPVRFDFGVRFDGSESGVPAAPEVKEMEIDEAMFVPGGADIRPEHLPVIARIAEQIREQRIGEVVIVTVAEGGLMEARVATLREALSRQLGAKRAASLGVSARKPGALGGAGVQSSGGTTSPISGTGR